MLGYCSNGYRLWDLEENELETGRVVFNAQSKAKSSYNNKISIQKLILKTRKTYKRNLYVKKKKKLLKKIVENSKELKNKDIETHEIEIGDNLEENLGILKADQSTVAARKQNELIQIKARNYYRKRKKEVGS